DVAQAIEQAAVSGGAASLIGVSEMLEQVIVRADANGNVVRGRDVGRFELARAARGFATVNGRPAVLVTVRPVDGAPKAGADLRVRVGEVMPLAFPVRVALAGADPAPLRAWADAIAARLGQGGSGVTELRIEPSAADVPRLEFEIDRERAAALGIDERDLADG